MEKREDISLISLLINLFILLIILGLIGVGIMYGFETLRPYTSEFFSIFTQLR